MNTSDDDTEERSMPFSAVLAVEVRKRDGGNPLEVGPTADDEQNGLTTYTDDA